MARRGEAGDLLKQLAEHGAEMAGQLGVGELEGKLGSEARGKFKKELQGVRNAKDEELVIKARKKQKEEDAAAIEQARQVINPGEYDHSLTERFGPPKKRRLSLGGEAHIYGKEK